MPLWLFFFLAVLAGLSALGVVLQRNPVHCLLGLAVNLLVMGVIFIGLGAVTVGFLQIIIYVGAILVMFLFVIWLLNLQAESLGGHLGLKLFGSLGAAVLAAELSTIFFHAAASTHSAAATPVYGSINNLGRSLFSDYLIAFEVTSLLLLAAVVGAIGLARRIPSAEQGQRREVLRPVDRRDQIPASIPSRADDEGEGRERRSA
ncbi:MAG TPA: NADH-quinone oxidoreductase subunit J [Candidatus Binataceae bacterium]|nr:NADH-quinone oxidoreductase subunit J [Candidatus Binataceae bacterium]